MAVDPVGFLEARQLSATRVAAAGDADFGAWLAQSLSRVNQDLARADEGLQQLATGQAQDLHQVMIALEEARIGVQLLVQVRNRLLESYQEVLRMQI